MGYDADLSFLFYTPTRIVFGANSANDVAVELQNLGCTKAVIVADPFLHAKTDIIAKIEKKLGAMSVGVFSEIPSDSGVHVINKGYAFAKSRGSLLLFLQGHPEYEERTLLKEYQRDVLRFLSGQQSNYPTLPVGYFGPEATALLNAFRSDVDAGRLAEPAASFPFLAVAATLSSNWRAPAARLYANWLGYVAERKQVAGIQNRRAL